MFWEPVLPMWGVVGVTFFFVFLGLWGGFKFVGKRRLWWVGRGVVYGLLVGVLLMRPMVPVWAEREQFTNQYDIYFVVDVTASMVAEDWVDGTENSGEDVVTRFDGVKGDIYGIVDEFAGSRYSLVTFSSQAEVVTPLTKDTSALVSAVNHLMPEVTRFSGGSDVGVAGELVNNLVEESENASPERTKLVFFFSDGETTSYDDGVVQGGSYTNANNFIDGGTVLGYGTAEGGRMKIQQGYYISNDQGYIQDPASGSDAISVIDEERLQNIAEELGVGYVHRDSGSEFVVPTVEANIFEGENRTMSTMFDYSWLVAFLLVCAVATDLGFIVSMLRKHKLFESK